SHAGRDGQGARNTHGADRGDGAPEHGNVGQDAGIDAVGLYPDRGARRRRRALQTRFRQASRLKRASPTAPGARSLASPSYPTDRRSDPPVDVRGKTILVTGAGRGVPRRAWWHAATSPMSPTRTAWWARLIR